MQENRDFIVPGALVKADVRSGQYIGEIVEVNGPRAVFKVLAVLKHPEQGDLHHPYNPDVAMFHERKALSYTEKTNVLLRDVKPFEGDVPDYNASLQEAVAAQIAALDRLMRWSARGLEILKELRKEYK
ncbi:kinase-associated lipoprotein B [Paenibacillus sp. MMO-58]|uniref:kinase-associated lipoprotein B n=1 Tax=Paenibacillus sp. MMO-58 TaxID=3081290 RepID=UPI003018EFCA